MTNPHRDVVRTLGVRMRAARVAAGLTVEDLARACDVARSTVERWERGSTIPTRLARKAIARALPGFVVAPGDGS